MRVLVTGITGFVGSHAAKALQDGGHEVRGLVRTPSKLESVTAPVGVNVESLDVVEGDATDTGVIDSAVRGCDAVVHAAALVSTDRLNEAEVEATNLTSAVNVLTAAALAGCDPIIHVSSAAALFPFQTDPVTADHPVGTCRSPYARSKANCERLARALQASGHPIVILYPGMVVGPQDHNGSTQTQPFTLWLTKPFPLSSGYTVTLVDVRDIAAVVAATMQSGGGARRYVMFGHHLSAGELLSELRSVTGRELKAVRLPKAMFSAWGALGDVMRRIGLESVLTSEAVDYMFNYRAGDYSSVEQQTGVALRAVRETLADTIDWMCDAGLVSEQQAGAARSANI